jgi:hypothetical protein
MPARPVSAPAAARRGLFFWEAKKVKNKLLKKQTEFEVEISMMNL